MKKFFKLVAVVLAIAVIICPMMSIVSSATSAGGYKIEAIDDNNLQLTISSTDGFIAYSASVGFNDASAFQSTYSSDGYTNGLKLIGYTTKTATKNSYNTPQISANATGSSLNILVMPTDINNLDLLTEVIIGIRVASNTTASLTKIQAADDGAEITDDPTLLSFPAADANTGVIDSTASDYISSNATTNAHTHSFTQQTQSAAYLRTAATCTANATYWYSCATCGLASSTNYFTATGTMLAHTPDNTETFVKADATCTEDAQYWQECSVCHQQLSTYWTKPNTALGHSMTYHAATASTCEYQGNDAYYSCSRCNKLFGDSAGANEVTLAEVTRALADHTASNTKTNLKTAATCTADAVYYQQCSVCGIKLNTTWTDTGSKLPHTVVEDAAVAATCTETGLTAGSHCSVCGETIVAQKTVPAKGHTQAEPVIENRVDATCTTAGSYDSVVYCSVCGAEISRETVDVPATEHTQAEPVIENRVDATCTTDGSYDTVVYCSVCNTELSRTHHTIPATGHTPAEAVEENRVEATCGVDGSYDSVVYCSVCHAEISRTHQTIPATGAHTYTYTSNGDGTHTVGCANCDYSAQEACDTAGTDGACSKCGYKAATEAVEDATLVFASVSPSYEKTGIQINFRVANTVLNKYADMEVVVVPDRYDRTTFNKVENPAEIVTRKSALANAGSTRKQYTYKDVMLYELGLNLSYMLRAYDAEGNFVAYSPIYTTSVNSKFRELLPTATAAAKRLYIDTLVVCNENMKNLAATNPTSDLATDYAENNVIAGLDLTQGSTSIGDCNNIDLFTSNSDQFTKANTAVHQVRISVATEKVPVITLRIADQSKTLDLNKLAVNVAYTSVDSSGEHPYSKTFTGSDFSYAGKYLQMKFDEIGLHDSNKDITFTCTYDGETMFTYVYSMETYESSMTGNATVGDLVTALIKVGQSFRAYQGLD